MLTKINLNYLILFFLSQYCFFASVYSDENLNKKLYQADIYIEYGEINKAFKILKSIDDNKNENFRLLLSYGRAYLKLRQFEKAKQYFENAIFTTELEDEEAYLGISKAYLEIGDFKNAYKNIRPLLKSRYKPAETELVLVDIELKTGYTDNARERLLKLIEIRTNDPDVIIGYAKYLFLNRDPYDAIAFLENEISKNQNIPKVYVYLGVIKGFLGLDDEKQELFLKASTIYEKLGYELRAKILLETANKFNNLSNKHNVIISLELPSTPKKTIERNLDKDKNLEKKNDNVSNEKIEQEDKSARSRKEKEEILENKKITNINFRSNISKKRLDISWLAKASENKNFVPFKTKEVFFGSGFVINDGSYVITNYHVIENTSIILIKTGIGRESAVEVAYYDKEIDIAILKLTDKVGTRNQSFAIDNFEDPKPGSDALVIGYPMPDFFGSKLPTITEGVVAKTTGLGNNPNNFLITSKINSGNSGGPIVNKKGCLIGIAVGKLDTKTLLEKLDMLPEDMNIGIKPSNALKLLGLGAENKCKLKNDINRVNLYEKLLPKVVFIIAGN